MNYIVFAEVKWLCAFTKYTTVFNKAIIYVNELILTPPSPFDITVNAKYLWKCIFRATRRLSFSYFPKGSLNNKRVGSDLWYLLEFLWIMLRS